MAVMLSTQGQQSAHTTSTLFPLSLSYLYSCYLAPIPLSGLPTLLNLPCHHDWSAPARQSTTKKQHTPAIMKACKEEKKQTKSHGHGRVILPMGTRHGCVKTLREKATDRQMK